MDLKPRPSKKIRLVAINQDQSFQEVHLSVTPMSSDHSSLIRS